MMSELRQTIPQFAVLAVLSCLFMGGCGSNGPRSFALSGQVVYDGTPVTSGNIGFVPAEPSSGKTVGAEIADGHYEIPVSGGLQEGNYNVVIYAERPTGRKLQADEGSSERVDELVQYIPDIYNARTTLSVEVSGDREDLDFALQKPKQGSRRSR